MSASTRVRPAFLKISIFVFAMLLPFAIYAAWDYVEVNRLNRRVAQLASRGEAARVVRQPSSPAWQFFRGAMAVADPNMTSPMNAEALRLLDRAVAMSFEGFPAGFSYNYFGGDLITLARVAATRTRNRVTSGDGAAASEALRAELRLQQPMADSMSMWFSLAISSVNLVLNRFRLDSTTLARLEDDLASLDDDSKLAHSFAAWRASLLETRVPPMRFPGSGPPPWQLRQTNEQIDVVTELIAASHLPWPARLDALGVPASWQPKRQPRSDDARAQQKTYGELAAHSEGWRLALVRSARSAVAVERYRRDHNEQLPSTTEDMSPAYLRSALVDPFSGGSLKLAVLQDGYVVYSLGVNRRDDSGSVRATRNNNVNAPRDFGIRIETDAQR
jgi:hypothetical protein